MTGRRGTATVVRVIVIAAGAGIAVGFATATLSAAKR